MAYTVYLDAGHGGYDNGAVGFGRTEKDDNLELTLAVGEILQENGVEVGYTRVEDVYDSPVRKAQIANEAGADLFISFHRNSSPELNQYQGVQTLLYDENGLKKEVADAINAALEEVGFVNLGTEERKNLAVLRRTEMPSLLVEAGFINSETDNAIFEQNFDEMARAIAAAIYTTLEENGLLSSDAEGLHSFERRNDPSTRTEEANPWNTEETRQQEMDRDPADSLPMDQDAPDAMQRANQTLENIPSMPNPNATMPENGMPNYSMPQQNSMSNGSRMESGEQGERGERRLGIHYGCWRDECLREPSYQIQTGLFRNYMNALRMKSSLERDGYPATIQLYKEFFAVRTGYYETLFAARQA